MQPYTDKIVAGAEGYTVEAAHDNKPLDTQSTFGSEARTVNYMKSRVAADPSLAASVHVLPTHEVNLS